MFDMAKLEELHNEVYDICEKIWNDTHDCLWMNGDMEERLRMFNEVKQALLRNRKANGNHKKEAVHEKV